MEVNIRQKKIVSLGDLTKMFQGLAVESNQEELSTCEIMMQKYVSFTYTHIFIRANCFYMREHVYKRRCVSQILCVTNSVTHKFQAL